MSSPAAKVEKFLREIGPKRTKQDRRRLWAHEDREYVGWEGLSRGERKARNRFAARVSGGADAVEVLKDVLGLGLGPIPAYEDEDSFLSYWSLELLEEIAARWQASSYFRSYARIALERAHNTLAAAAPKFAEALIETANDETAPKMHRLKASQIALSLAGLSPGKPPQPDIKSVKSELKRRAKRSIEASAVPVPEGTDV